MSIPTSPSNHTYLVELRFFGELLEPTQVTSILGIQPSTYSGHERRLGDRKREAFWGYNGREHPDFQVDWLSLEEGLAFVARRLAPLKPQIIELSKRFDELWWCGHFQSSFNGGPTLSPQILNRIASFGCSLYLDNYFCSDERSPSAAPS